MYTNTCCTLYLKSLDYEKVEINNAFITKRTPFTLSKLGLSYTESAMCMFEGQTSLVFTPGKDFMVEGKCDAVLSGLVGQAYTDALKRLISEKHAMTIMEATYLKYGTPRMHHWELSCK